MGSESARRRRRRPGEAAVAVAAPGRPMAQGREPCGSPAGASRDAERHERRRRRREAQQLQQIRHLESFYEKPPPGLIKENETKPEDCIPDVPGNESAREFLAHAPTKGLWMPLGKEVKVMQCKCEKIPSLIGPFIL